MFIETQPKKVHFRNNNKFFRYSHGKGANMYAGKIILKLNSFTYAYTLRTIVHYNKYHLPRRLPEKAGIREGLWHLHIFPASRITTAGYWFYSRQAWRKPPVM